MQHPTRAPRVGLVTADRTPEPVLTRAPRDTFDRMLHDHLGR
ncbi:hypothetical protein [Streptosporangium oxazolinicum]